MRLYHPAKILAAPCFFASLLLTSFCSLPAIAEDRPEPDDQRSVKQLRKLRVRMTLHKRRVVSVELTNNPRAREALPFLAGLRNVRTLNLRQVDVGDQDLKHLASLTTLVALDLSDSKVTDEGLPTLAPLINLKQLSLRGSDCTLNGARCLGAPHTLTTDFQLGTAINWAESFGEAAALAKSENKLLFVIHVSGDFSVPEDT